MSTELAKEQVLDKDSPDPVEQAAAMYSMYWERFHTLCNKLSSKELKRIILKNVLEPLEDSGYQYQTDKERDAGNLMGALLEAKYLMILHVGVQEQQRLQAEALLKESQETATDSLETNAVIEKGNE